MGQLGHGGMLFNVRQGAVVLLCVFTISLLSSTTTRAVSVDPLLNTVTSVVKLNNSDDSTTNNKQHGMDRPVSSSRSTTVPSTASSTAPAPTVAPESAPAVIAEPLEQLPSIDIIETPPQKVIIYRPAAELAVSPAVFSAANDTITPLQSSNHGWKLFGFAWYWWALVILAGYHLVRRLIFLQRRRASENAVVADV